MEQFLWVEEYRPRDIESCVLPKSLKTSLQSFVDKETHTDDVKYEFWFKVENLKVMPGSYDVEVSSKKISHFTNTKLGVQYWIALEPESSYND